MRGKAAALSRWVVTFVLFAGLTVALCGALLGLRACRGKAEDRPHLAPILVPWR
jgi:hypothetical protein